MNTNVQTLTRFYTAFAALNADTMASCYALDAVFDDPAFSLKGHRSAGAQHHQRPLQTHT